MQISSRRQRNKLKMKKTLLILIVLQLLLIAVGYADAATDEFSVINVKDKLSITVVDNPGLSTEVVVLEDGYINFPYIGSLYVKGRRVKDVEAEITKKLGEGFLKYPVVSVRLSRGFETRSIFLYGEVQKRGDMPFQEKLTVLKALSLAGGMTEDGLYGDVKIRRKVKSGKNYENIVIDIEGIINESQSEDILLQPDDVVIVDRNKTYIVEGEVGKPGKYPLKKGMTVSRALSEAGGITKEGLYGAVNVRRKINAGEGYENIAIDLEGILNENRGKDILLQPDDVVIVDRNKTYIVEGEVGKPGEYPLKKGMTVSRALSEAGGITKEGLYGAVKVRRKQREDQTYKDIDIVLGRGLENNVSGDMLLRYDDILIVERNDIFYIYGEVNKPGDYALQKGLTAFTALSLAGGLTKWGSQDQIKILRRSAEEKNTFVKIKVNIEDVIKGDASADALLYPGDILIISSGIF